MPRERKYRCGERMFKRNNLIQTKDLPIHPSIMPTFLFLARTQLFPVPLETRFITTYERGRRVISKRQKKSICHVRESCEKFRQKVLHPS